MSESRAKDEFVRRVLREEAQNIDEAQTRLMTSRGFTTSALYDDRTFNIDDNILEYRHLTTHRFIDIRSRNTKQGKKKKKAHPIHNRIVFGHLNNMISKLAYGYTEEIKRT